MFPRTPQILRRNVCLGALRKQDENGALWLEVWWEDRNGSGVEKGGGCRGLRWWPAGQVRLPRLGLGRERADTGECIALVSCFLPKI